MAIWGAVITGVVAAGSSYYQASQAKKAQKSQLKADRSEWEQRMAYENEKLSRKQNSMGAKMAPYLMDQMLHVYGEQTKGRGGFTLPIEEILKNMNIEGRKNGTYNSQSQGQNYDSSPSTGQGRVSGPAGRKIDPEAYGYNGKSFDHESGMVDGDPFAREFTHDMGGVTTQTERGYNNRTIGNEPGFSISQKIPIQTGKLSTGGVGQFESRDIEIPKDLAMKLGVMGLKAGMSTVIPGIGLIMNIGGKFVQKFGHSDGKQSRLETLFGIKDANYGRFFGKSKTPATTQRAGESNPLSPYIELV